MHDLVIGAAPSVKMYLKVRTMWKDIMLITNRNKRLELYLLSEPLAIKGDVLHIGAYSPSVAAVIKRYEDVVLRQLKKNGLNINRLVIKVIGKLSESEKSSQENIKKFAEEEIRKAEKLFSMVEDSTVRRKLAIVWLKSKRTGGGIGSV